MAISVPAGHWPAFRKFANFDLIPLHRLRVARNHDFAYGFR
jgi:hypothetical protein